ncbi:MAG: bifunctional phosphoribosylaminoimidazolecarboxamide formyltransferase/IMP cyclohydrolase [Alphaproteobacteria bacterium]
MPAQIARALLSVSDKTGLVPFAQALAARGFALVSTGGTARALAAAGLEVEEVGALTGVGEFLDGRVKTLHPAVHGGLLARSHDPGHRAALDARGIEPFDLLVVNLYSFRETVASGAGEDEVVETIDIGGPAMLRAAAKNHASLAVVCDPADYNHVLEMMDSAGELPPPLRRRLAAKAFAHTASYDAAIAEWFQRTAGDDLPETLVVAAHRVQRCRYGENPHQDAAVYRTEGTGAGLVGATQLQGKELSYNNFADTDAAWSLVRDLDEPALAIIKHANPCGAAVADTLEEAWQLALASDPTSAFGGIIAVNRPLTAGLAELVATHFAEVVIAPEVAPAALTRLGHKTALRVLTAALEPANRRVIRSIEGGLLVQSVDDAGPDPVSWRVVSARAPTDAEIRDLVFAQTVAKHVKSNAVVLARKGATVGVGAGQMSRVDAVRIAVRKAAEGAGAKPCVCASDAFFPFADGLEAAANAGATAVIQPGGSKRDDEVIAAADRLGVAMVFTATRHFRH